MEKGRKNKVVANIGEETLAECLGYVVGDVEVVVQELAVLGWVKDFEQG